MKPHLKALPALLSSASRTPISRRRSGILALTTLVAVALGSLQPAVAQAQSTAFEYRVPLHGLKLTVPGSPGTNPDEPGGPGTGNPEDELPGGSGPGEGDSNGGDGGTGGPVDGTIMGTFVPLPGYSANFGLAGFGRSTTQRFVFRNTGAVPAVIGAQLTANGPDTMAITANECGTPASLKTVQPGQTCEVTVQFSATTDALTTATLAAVGEFVGGQRSMTLSGRGTPFVAEGAWSTQGTNQTAPTAGTLSFGIRATDADAGVKSFYLRRINDMGELAAGFRLEGDTAHFRLAGVETYSSYGSLCLNGPMSYTEDHLATLTQCRASADAGNKHIHVVVQYKPTEIGSHSVRLVPITTNGSVLPEPLTLTGAGQFNPAAVWSVTSAVQSEPSAVARRFGPVDAGQDVYKTFYLYNTGSYGSMAAGFALSGDTAQFELSSVRQYIDGQYLCMGSSGRLSTDNLSTQSPCLTSSAPYRIQVTVRYVGASEPGTHTVLLVPSSNNGTALPPPLALTGETR